MRNSNGFPLYVRAGLLGVRSRRQAWLQFWVALAVSTFLFLLLDIGSSFFWTLVYVGSVLLTARWFLACIRWVDEHANWEKE